MGLKESAAAAGGVIGPLLITVLAGMLTPNQVYLIAFVITLFSGLFAILYLRQPRTVTESLSKSAVDSSIRP
jgi:hypothetical protein